MKKRISFVTALLISVAMLASCGQAGSAAGSSEPAAEASSAAASTAESINMENYRTVFANIEGFGQVSIAEEGADPAFDPDFPTQSAAVNKEVGSSVTVAAKPDEGWKILKWTKNGENIGSDAEITFTLEEDTNLVVTFSKANPNENAKLADMKTVGDLFKNVAEQQSMTMDGIYVYAFELGGSYYRAVAEMPTETFDAYMALDFSDEQYDEKAQALLGDLAITRIEDLNQAVPTQEQLDALVGKTFGELLEDGWMFDGYNFEEMIFTGNHDISMYELTMEGEAPADYADFTDEDLADLKVVSAKYCGLGDLTNMDYEAPLAEE